MRAEKFRAMAEKLFVGGGDLGALLRDSFGDALRSHDWSQTPLGAVETWSDDLKAAVQILLTELDQTTSPKETQRDAQERQDNSAVLYQANQLNAFRVKLAEALRPLTDASEIQAIAARILGESLGASRVIYIEVVSAGEEVIVHCNYTNGVAQLSGRYRLEDYRRNLTADHQVEHTQVVTDIPNDPKYTDAQKTKYRDIDIAAHIDVPLIKNNQFVALLAVQQSTPRQWTQTEVKLVEETAEQTWAAVERAYAEAALRESEAKYRTLFESIDEGFCIAEILFDENDTPVDYRFLEINPVFEQQTKLQQAVGKTARQLVPDIEDFWIETYGRVALTGEPVRFENRSAPMNRWFDVYACRTGQPEDRKVAIVFKDISDRKRAEAQQAYLLKLSDALRPLSDPVSIKATGTRILGEHLAADRVLYCEYVQQSDEDYWLIENVYHQSDYPFPDGLYPLQSFGRDAYEAMKGNTVIVNDVLNDAGISPDAKETFKATAIAAYVALPLMKEGKFVALLSLHSCTPRQWKAEELDLLWETANRTWAAVERARASAALSTSEEKYRTLFESIDQGFCVIEVLFDENSQPFDYRFLEINPAFEKQTGLIDAQGKRVQELVPNHEAHWFEIYGNIALTGEPNRFENRAAALNRWYDVYAFRIGHPDERKVAVLFNDITDRKRVEDERKRAEKISQQAAKLNALRVSLTDALRPLADPVEIQATASRVLGEYLGANRVAYFEIRGADYVVEHDYVNGADALAGRYSIDSFGPKLLAAYRTGRAVSSPNVSADPYLSPEQQSAYAAIQIGAYIGIPLIKKGEFVAGLAVHAAAPRDWKPEEIALTEEVAERTWAAVERARAEAALRQSEQRFRLMADAVPQIVWITDTEGRVEFFNKQWSNYTGASYEPTTAAEVAASFVHPEDGDRTIEAFDAARLRGGIFSVEHRIRSAAGTYRWFLVRAEPYRDLQTGEIIRWFGASIDIHDRKQAEAIIATDLENTRLLRDLSARMIAEDNIQVLYDEIVSAAITLTRADAGSIQALDESTQELVLIATQGIDRTVTDRFGRVAASSITSCGRVLATGKRAFVDFDTPESEDPDGSLGLHLKTGLISAQSTPLITRSGRRIGMVSTHWRKHHRPTEQELRFLDLLVRQAADLIEQRQAEAERKQILEREQAAREEAERANRIKDEFLAVLSHELRSPLNPILGWTQLLQNGKLNEARRAEALKTIERNAKLQTQLIEDLLDISRIMQGKLSLLAAPVSLTFVISAAIETVRLAAEAKNIRLQLDLDNTVAPISGDAARLQQVVWNLLNNAVKFTPNGGKVTVELRQLNQLAQIRVIDTGKGINPQFLPYMFEYFRQEDGSTTRKFGGLGLGLAIARQIVQMHGGTVRAESQGEGQGATLIVQLPAMRVAPLVSEPVQTQIDAGLLLEGIHILLVDDEPDTNEFQAFLLEQSGAKVTAVASGLEALLALEQSIPDVLVSDIGMAQMDGYMLLQQIRSRPPNQGGMIRAIALTAYAAQMDQHRALQVGFQAHITKPVEPDVLVRAIAILLGRT